MTNAVVVGAFQRLLDSRPVSGHGVTFLRENDERVGMIQGRRLYWLTSMSNCLILRCKLRRPNWIC